MAAAVATAAAGLFPPLTVEEQQRLAQAILTDAQRLFVGKAGATLAITNAHGEAITARTKAVDIIAFRMRQYRETPALWGYFIRRHDDGGAFWARLKAWYITHHSDAARMVYTAAAEGMHD